MGKERYDPTRPVDTDEVRQAARRIALHYSNGVTDLGFGILEQIADEYDKQKAEIEEQHAEIERLTHWGPFAPNG